MTGRVPQATRDAAGVSACHEPKTESCICDSLSLHVRGWRMEEEMKASGLPHSALVGEPGTLGMSKGAGWNDGGRCPSVQRS